MDDIKAYSFNALCAQVAIHAINHQAAVSNLRVLVRAAGASTGTRAGLGANPGSEARKSPSKTAQCDPQ